MNMGLIRSKTNRNPIQIMDHPPIQSAKRRTFAELFKTKSVDE
jgi:hypothetical protein